MSTKTPTLLITSLSLALLSLPASADGGRAFNLVDSSAPSPSVLKAATAASALPGKAGVESETGGFLEGPGTLAGPLRVDFEDALSGLTIPFFDRQDTDAAGCRVDPASPAIGADVPLTYFGVPSPGTNPSLVGAVQLLSAGVLNAEERYITLPLYEGRFLGTDEEVWFIATDTTDEVNAQALGINHSAKLTFGETGRGTRTARLVQDGLVVFDQGRVDFSPVRNLVPGAEPNPFPPAVAQPGAVGDSLYTPLVKIENAGGHIYNLPVVGWGSADGLVNDDGTPNYANVHDSVVSINFDEETITLELAAGFSFGRPVLYISTDSNSPIAATLEGAILAPGLDDIDVGNDDSLFSAVERIFITINGPRACENPQRQGLNAAVTDGEAPFNVLGGIPTIAPDYSPLWDANIGQWTQEAIDAGYRSRLIDEFQILSFVEFGFITGPGGAEYGSTGIIINCPIVHRFL